MQQHLLDDLARSLASDMPRRKLLQRLGAGLAAGILGAVFHGGASASEKLNREQPSSLLQVNGTFLNTVRLPLPPIVNSRPILPVVNARPIFPVLNSRPILLNGTTFCDSFFCYEIQNINGRFVPVPIAPS